MNNGRSVLQEVTITVSGMGCAGCAQTIEKNLRSKNGVADVSVHIREGKAHVTYDRSMISLSDIEAAIEESGYAVVRK